jgi:hypothetical protein
MTKAIGSTEVVITKEETLAAAFWSESLVDHNARVLRTTEAIQDY